jgi:hypothetical protein
VASSFPDNFVAVPPLGVALHSNCDASSIPNSIVVPSAAACQRPTRLVCCSAAFAVASEENSAQQQMLYIRDELAH